MCVYSILKQSKCPTVGATNHSRRYVDTVQL